MIPGVRLYTGIIPVPKRMALVWHATMVRTVKASRPQDSPVKKVSYPSESACCANDSRDSLEVSPRVLKVREIALMRCRVPDK